MDMARDILVLLFIIASAAKTTDAVSTTDASTTALATTEAPSTTTYPTTTTTTEVTTTTTTNASTTNNSSTEETTTSSAQVTTNTPTDSSSSTTTTTTKTSTEETTSSPTNADITSTTTNDSTSTITTVSTTTGKNNSQTSTIGSSSSTQPSPTSTLNATTDSSKTEKSTILLTTSTPHDNGATNPDTESTFDDTTIDASTLSSTSTTNGSTSSTISTSHLTTVGITTVDTSSTSPGGTTSSETTTSNGATVTTPSANISDNTTTTSEFTSSQTTEFSTTSTNTNTGTTTTVSSTMSSSESSSEPTTTPTTKATVIPTAASSSTAGTAKPGFSTVAPNKNAVFILTLTVETNNQTDFDDLIQKLGDVFKSVVGFLRVVKGNRVANENGAQSQSHFRVSFDANQNVNETEVENAIDRFNQSTNYKLRGTTMPTFARQIGDRCLIDDFCRNGFICLDKGKCYSKCASPDRECQNEGTCFVSVNETVTKTLCRCKTEEFYRYEGEHCENKVMKWELAVAIAAGSGGALVIILLFIIIILCAKRSSDSKYKHIKNSGGSSGAYANDAELNVYRPRQSTKYKESGLDQVDLQPGYDNKAYDFDSLPDSDSQGNSSFLHSSSNKRWDPDASSETYAKIYRQLEDTNYQVGIKRPQVSTRRNEVLTGF